MRSAVDLRTVDDRPITDHPFSTRGGVPYHSNEIVPGMRSVDDLGISDETDRQITDHHSCTIAIQIGSSSHR
jgi:hypothetical protein